MMEIAELRFGDPAPFFAGPSLRTIKTAVFFGLKLGDIPKLGQSTGWVETNPYSLGWYQWDYLRSPAKNLYFCRVFKIGTDYQPLLTIDSPLLTTMNLQGI